MKSGFFRQWLPLVLIFWGIPTMLLWLGFGFYFRLAREWEIEERYQNLNASLNEVSEKSEEYLAHALNSGFELLSRDPVNSREFEQSRLTFERGFPPGLLRVFYFDDRGGIISQSKASAPAVLPDFFEYIGRSYTEAGSIPPHDFRGMEEFLHSPKDLASFLREQKGRVVPLTNNRDKFYKSPTWAFYQKNPAPAPGRLGGMVVFIYYQFLSDAFLLEKGIAALASGAPDIGFVVPGEKAVPPRSVADSEFPSLIRSFQTEPTNRFTFQKFLVEGRSYGFKGLILAMEAIPQGPVLLREIVYFLYAVLSLVFLIGWWLVSQGRWVFPFRLTRKFAFLFVSGIAFPLVMSSGFALLYLEEKKKEILEESRETASRKLEKIDESFGQEMTRRELYYKSLTRNYSEGKKDLAQIGEELRRLVREFRAEWFFIIDRDNRILFEEAARKDADYRFLLNRPFQERLREMRIGFRNNSTPENDELECLLDQRPISSIHPKFDATNRKMVEKLLSMLVEDAINYAHALQGKPAIPPGKKAGVGLEGLVDDDNQGLFKMLKLSMGKLLPTYKILGKGFLYTQVLTRPDRADSFFLILTHSYFGLQNEYLSAEFSEEKRFTPDGELRAIGFETNFSRAYPFKENDPYRKVHSRLNSSKGQTLVFRMNVEGKETEIVALRAGNLQFVDLLHAMPLSRLDEKLFPYKIRASLFIVGTCVFGFIIGYLLLQTLVVPLFGMVDGIGAIQKKEFSHRISVVSANELGRLCQSLNKTISHLGDMEMASSIQNNLFPERSLRLGSYEFSGKNIMTQAIGGDYFDFFPIAGNRCVVVLGDVAGHGVSAALVTAMAKAGFMILCPLFWEKPEQVLMKLNTQFFRILRRMKMMTCFLGIYDAERNILVCANAGQAAPIIQKDDQAPSFFLLNSNPLGIVEKIKIKTSDIVMGDQDLVLYTDGLVEALMPSNESVGYETFSRLVGQALKDRTVPPTERIFQDVKKLTDPIPWNDDATVLVMKRRKETT